MGLKNLEKAIKDASQKYYTEGTSPYSDQEFDSMLDSLKQQNPESELLTAVGHGYDVDEYVSKTGKKKVKHKYGIVGSLEKAYSWEDLRGTFKDRYVDVSLKLDGLSVVLYYQDGIFYQALTRGVNGYGIDITDKVKHILHSTEQRLEDDSFTGAVRGEIIMTDNRFEDFKRYVDTEAKNSRNSTAGIINGKDVDVRLLQYLRIVVYSVIGVESIDLERKQSNTIDDIIEMRYWLENNFSSVVPFEDVTLSIDTYYEDLESKLGSLTNRSYYYPYDGLVLTASVYTENNQVIYVSQAFKFSAESGETTVKGVEWNLTKTRYLMPKINVEPLFLSGTNVENATGYNAKYIQDNRIGVGTKLRISKHGEIIPNVDEIIEPTGAQLPEVCPDCGEKLKWNGVHLQCVNEFCGNAQIQDLMIWIHTLVPTDFLGDKLILKYLSMWYERNRLNIGHVMMTNPDIDDGEELGVQGNMVKSMLQTLRDDGTRFKLVDAIKALNIPRFGDVNAEKLSHYPALIKGLISTYENYQVYKNIEPDISIVEFETDLMVIEDEFSKQIGNANMKSLIRNIEKVARLNYIWDNIIWETEPSVETKGKVAITGKLSVKRSEFEKELKAAGYEVKEISKDTDFLITDNPGSSSSKNKKADQWGIVKISEEEFRSRYLS